PLAAGRPGQALPACWAASCSAMLARTSSMSSSRALVMSSLSAAAGRAPGCAYSTTLSRMIISVGMELMPNEAASSCWASVSTLPTTASGYSSDACSKIGPNMRQGPHHAAQKSTSARSAPPITDSKFSAVSSTVAIGASSAAQGISLRYPAGYRTRAHPRPFPAAGLPPGARRAPHRPAPPPARAGAGLMPGAGAVAREGGRAGPRERHDHGLRRAVQLDAPPRRRGLGERFGPGELFVHTHGVEVPGL